MERHATLQCPMCAFNDADSYVLSLHVETMHFAQDSPFVVRQDAPHPEMSEEYGRDVREPAPSQVGEASRVDHTNHDEYIVCPEEDCGEEVQSQFYQEHLDYHLAERCGLEEESAAAAADMQRELLHVGSKFGNDQHDEKASLSRKSTAVASSVHSKSILDVKRCRLGKAELGPHAFEKRMPLWLHNMLDKGAKETAVQKISADGRLYRETVVENEVRGMIPVIERILHKDPTVRRAYLCHPAVQHVFKMPKEGSFCGYRNLQMLSSFIIETERQGWQKLCKGRVRKDGGREKKLPNILDLQELIEQSWDAGINAHGRFETGGIWDTRKYIGTPEAESLLCYLSTPHTTQAFVDCVDGGQLSQAHEQLLNYVEQYFSNQLKSKGLLLTKTNLSELDTDTAPQIYRTLAAPLYFQQPGHSMTIIGLEVRHDGSRNLLVLDPAYRPSPGIKKMLSEPMEPSSPSSSRRKRDSYSQSTTSKLTKPRKEDAGESSRSGSRSKDALKSVQLLEAYRRGERRLRRHREFELVVLLDQFEEL